MVVRDTTKHYIVSRSNRHALQGIITLFMPMYGMASHQSTPCYLRHPSRFMNPTLILVPMLLWSCFYMWIYCSQSPCIWDGQATSSQPPFTRTAVDAMEETCHCCCPCLLVICKCRFRNTIGIRLYAGEPGVKTRRSVLMSNTPSKGKHSAFDARYYINSYIIVDIGISGLNIALDRPSSPPPLFSSLSQ